MLELTDTQRADRLHSLELEKQLASIHKILARRLEEERSLGNDDISDSLQAALWHVGVAILRTAALQ